MAGRLSGLIPPRVFVPSKYKSTTARINGTSTTEHKVQICNSTNQWNVNNLSQSTNIQQHGSMEHQQLNTKYKDTTARINGTSTTKHKVQIYNSTDQWNINNLIQSTNIQQNGSMEHQQLYTKYKYTTARFNGTSTTKHKVQIHNSTYQLNINH